MDIGALRELDRLQTVLVELKVRRVRTPAGQRRFKQPIGSIITRKGRLKNLKLLEPKWEGWDLVEGPGRKRYDVGRDDDGVWRAYEHTRQQRVVAEADTEDEVFDLLDELVEARPRVTRAPNKPRTVRTTQHVESDYPGFEKFKGADGKTYWAWEDDDNHWVIEDENEQQVGEAEGLGNVAAAIDNAIEQRRNYAEIRPDLVRTLDEIARSGGPRGVAAKHILDLGKKYPNAVNLMSTTPVEFQSHRSGTLASVSGRENGLVMSVNVKAIEEAWQRQKLRALLARNSPLGPSEHHVVDRADIPTLDDMVKGVVTHEFGHVAHWLVAAQQIEPGGSRLAMGNIAGTFGPGTHSHGTEGLKHTTQYSHTSQAEKFAEWFAAMTMNVLRPEEEPTPEFVARFNEAMKKKAEIVNRRVQAKSAPNESECGGLNDEAAWTLAEMVRQSQYHSPQEPIEEN